MRKTGILIILICLLSLVVLGQRRRPFRRGQATTMVAITDTETRIEPEISGALDLSVGGRGAGYKFTDPYYGSEILRVTDGSTLDDPAFTGNKPSLNLASSADHRIWNANGTRFWVGAQFGGAYPFSFDPSTFTATRLNETANTASDGTYMRIPSASAEPWFSFVDPDILWFIDGRGGSDSHTIVSYNFATDAITTFYDLDGLGFTLTDSVPNKTGTGVGLISASDAYPTEKICVEFGGRVQEEHYLMGVFNRDNPATRRILNTRTCQVGTQLSDMAEIADPSDMHSAIAGTVSITSGGSTITGSGTQFTATLPVGGDVIVNGERKTISGVTNNTSASISGTWGSTVSGATLQTYGFGLHSALIGKDGRYVWLYRGMPYSPGESIVFVWDTQNDTVTHVTHKPYGHAESGYSEWLNVTDEGPTSAPFWFFRRPASAPNNSGTVTRINNYSPPLYDVADHSSWNTQSRYNQNTPVIDSSYLLDYLRSWQPYDNEILAVRTDQTNPNNMIYRLAHTRANIKGDAGGFTQFDYSPRANVDPTGRFILYASNHRKTLGNRYNGSGDSLYRVDIFCLRIPTLPVPVANVLASPAPAASSITTTTATIGASLDNAGDFSVFYAADPTVPTTATGTYAKDFNLLSGARTVGLTGLTAGTTYNLLIRARNQEGTAGTTQTLQFTTSGAPSYFVNDTFTDTDGDELAAQHTGETGATWTNHASYAGTFTIQTNRAAKDTSSSSALAYASGTSGDLLYSVETELVDVSAANLSFGAGGWIDTATDSGIYIRRQNSTTFQFIKIVSGSATSLDTAATTFSVGATHTLRVTRTAGANALDDTDDEFEWFLDEVSQGSFVISDSVFTSIGRVGLRATGVQGAAVGYHANYLRAY